MLIPRAKEIKETDGMSTLKQRLSQILLGQKGGQNRIQIIESLKVRPYNLNQLAEVLNLNYRTIRHHMDVLIQNGLVTGSTSGGYGEVFFLSSELETDLKLYDEIIAKMKDMTTSSNFFQNVIEQTNVAVIVVDGKGDVFFWNNSAEKIFGYNEEEVLGKKLIIFPKARALEKILTQVSKEKSIERMRTKGVKRSGQALDISITVDPVTGNNGQFIGYSILIRDISEYIRMEEELKDSKERFALAERAAEMGSWDWDITTGNLKWSDTIEPLFGFEPGTFGKTYEGFLNCVHPEDRKFVEGSVNASVEKGKKYSIDHRIVWPDGTVHWMKERGAVIRDTKGKAVRMLGIVHDITEQKDIEFKLKHMASFPELNPNPIFEIDLIKNLVFSNKGTKAALKRIGAKNDIRVLFPADLDEIIALFKEGKKDHALREVMVSNMTFQIDIVHFPEFNTIRFYAIEVTEEKATEIKYHAILENSPEGFWINDMKGRIVEVNDAFCRMTGYSRDELIKMSIRDLEVEEDSRETERHIKKLIEDGYDLFETRHRRKDGTILPLEICANYSSLDGGRLIVFLRDISERAKVEEALRESEKYYRMIFDLSPMGIGIADFEGNILAMNKAGEEILGWTWNELRRMNAKDLYADPKDRKKILIDLKKNNKLLNQEIRLRASDGAIRYVLNNIHLVEIGGKPCVLTSIRDMTDIKKQQEALEQEIERLKKVIDGT